jgi:hypothetical protein
LLQSLSGTEGMKMGLREAKVCSVDKSGENIPWEKQHLVPCMEGWESWKWFGWINTSSLVLKGSRGR